MLNTENKPKTLPEVEAQKKVLKSNLISKNMIKEISKSRIDKDELIASIIRQLSPFYFINQGIPALKLEDHLIWRSVYGLGQFLRSWCQMSENNLSLKLQVRKFLEFTIDYLNYAKKVLQFIRNNHRVPETHEIWELEIPIDETHMVLDLINLEMEDSIFHELNLKEKKYYDRLSRSLITADKRIRKFNLEELTVRYNFNLIDAKIIPIFVNQLLKVETLNTEVQNYLNLSELPTAQLENLNRQATRIFKLQVSRKEPLNILELANTIDASILETGEALYFLNYSDSLIHERFSREKITELSKTLAVILEYCQNQELELSRKLMLIDFKLDLYTAEEIIELYGKRFSLPEELSRMELKRLDGISRSVIKYTKEVKKEPTIDDLIVDLKLNVQDAKIIFPFINKYASELLKEDFKEYPEEILLDIDLLSCKILKFSDNMDNEDLISLAYHMDEGMYSIKRSIEYIDWVQSTVKPTYIKSLPEKEHAKIGSKVKVVLKHIRENNLELNYLVLIDTLGFSLMDTYLIIGFYNDIISKKVNISGFPEIRKKKSENLARDIYRAKKKGQIKSFEPEEVFSHPFNSATLEELWDAINYLKVKVLDELMGEIRFIKTELGSINSKEAVRMRERQGIKIGKKEKVKLTKKSITLKTQKIKFITTEDKVHLKRGFDFVGGLIRYKVVIKNNTEMLINNIEIMLQMTAEHIRIIDIKPVIYREGNHAKISNMSPGQSESVDFYLEPLICGSIPVAPMAIYINAFGKPKIISRDHLNVVSKCPPIINSGEENIAKVKNIYRQEDMVNSFRSFKLKYDARRSFDLLREAIGSWAGKSVSNPIYHSNDPFNALIYFYVLNQNPDPQLGHREQIIIKISVNETKKVALLNIAAEKQHTTNGVLTHIWQLANERFGNVFGYKLSSLRCPQCAAPIKSMEEMSPLVTCDYCGETFKKSVLT